jgi:hypothetical protein
MRLILIRRDDVQDDDRCAFRIRREALAFATGAGKRDFPSERPAAGRRFSV